MRKFVVIQSMLLLSNVGSVTAQQDSLFDVFPLAIGNEWTYHYYKRSFDYLNESRSTDSGTAFFRVSGKLMLPDSTVWIFEQRRDIIHSWWSLSGGTGSSHIVDSASLEIIERHDGQHQLYLPGNALMHAGEVFPFTRDFTDTTMILRFRSVDSNGVVRFRSGTPTFPVYGSGFFECERGRGIVTVQCSSRITGSDVFGNHSLSDFVIVEVDPSIFKKPWTMNLFQNYPNPFNPLTTIRFVLRESGLVTLRVYDLLGREVAELLNERRKPGQYEVRWDATGKPSGVYFCRMRAEDYVVTRKLILLE